MDNPDNVPQDNQGRPQVLSHNDEMALKVAYLIARADPGVRNFDLIKYGKSTKTNDTWCECLKRLLGL